MRIRFLIFSVLLLASCNQKKALIISDPYWNETCLALYGKTPDDALRGGGYRARTLILRPDEFAQGAGSVKERKIDLILVSPLLSRDRTTVSDLAGYAPVLYFLEDGESPPKQGDTGGFPLVPLVSDRRAAYREAGAYSGRFLASSRARVTVIFETGTSYRSSCLASFIEGWKSSPAATVPLIQELTGGEGDAELDLALEIVRERNPELLFVSGRSSARLLERCEGDAFRLAAERIGRLNPFGDRLLFSVEDDWMSPVVRYLRGDRTETALSIIATVEDERTNFSLSPQN
jgi:hypothetical protein